MRKPVIQSEAASCSMKPNRKMASCYCTSPSSSWEFVISLLFIASVYGGPFLGIAAACRSWAWWQLGVVCDYADVWRALRDEGVSRPWPFSTWCLERCKMGWVLVTITFFFVFMIICSEHELCILFKLLHWNPSAWSCITLELDSLVTDESFRLHDSSESFLWTVSRIFGCRFTGLWLGRR